jgi:hypothetical protein
LLLLLCRPPLNAQTDSTRVTADSSSLTKAQKKEIYSSPRKASLMSAILPGLGQAYNKKYWKVPLIYGALGGLSYMFYFTNSKYNDYRRGLKQSLITGTADVDGFVLETDDLQSRKLDYKKYRDYAAIGLAIVYLLNIVDANVDAHLKTFDVSDDLSMRIEPWFKQGQTSALGNGAGLTFKLYFR